MTIYLKYCNFYFLSIDSDLEVDLRINALFLQEFLEWYYVHMHIKAFLGFWEPHEKHPFQNSFHDPSDLLFNQAFSVHERKKKNRNTKISAMSNVYKLPTGFLAPAIVFKILPLNTFSTSMIIEFVFCTMFRKSICGFVKQILTSCTSTRGY